MSSRQRTPLSVAPSLAHRVRIALGLLVTAAIGAMPASASRVTEQQPVLADTLTERAFDIPGQGLASALAEFRRQSGLRVTAKVSIRPGLLSPGVSGTRTPSAALRALLAGTGFSAVFSDGSTAALKGDRAAVQTIAPVEVVAKRAHKGGYAVGGLTSATKTATLLRDVPQSITVVTKDQIADQSMQNMADVVRYVPGITMGQGEGNRDQPTIRGNSTSAGFFVDGVRDDVQYFRDLYNVERVEALKGANALIFGRGVGGGVINRVSKEAEWSPVRELGLQGGSYDNKRVTADLGQGVSDRLAVRLNGMYESSDLFRHGVSLERWGINPTLTIAPSSRTKVTAGFEHFDDHRTADRGLPSFGGGPAGADIKTFFGDPDVSYSHAQVDAGSAGIEHTTSSGLTLRNRSRFAHYDKIYQNVFPGGAVNAAGTEVNLSAYNNATRRSNLFNQSELVYQFRTGALAQTLLGGVEVGRQVTDNFRNTGFFNDATTSLTVPFDHPTVSTPVTFRQGPTDADNHVTTTTLSFYTQDQIALGARWQVIAGIRYERFDLDFHNRRNDQTLARTDNLLSPRLGLLFKATDALSLYSSYGVSYLPSSGDQFSSLTATTETLKPEGFTNYEVGLRWSPVQSLTLSTALYRLDRTNTSAPDPADASKTIQTGSQRTNGFELAASGNVTAAWEVSGGYGHQNAFITSRTSAAPAGAKVALVPSNTVSLWNKYRFTPAVGFGVGVIQQSRMFAAVDNTVTLPAFVRFDAAGFVRINRNIRAQVNLENLFDRKYFVTSNGNNNISPGSPRAFRIAVITGF